MIMFERLRMPCKENNAGQVHSSRPAGLCSACSITGSKGYPLKFKVYIAPYSAQCFHLGCLRVSGCKIASFLPPSLLSVASFLPSSLLLFLPSFLRPFLSPFLPAVLSVSLPYSLPSSFPSFFSSFLPSLFIVYVSQAGPPLLRFFGQCVCVCVCAPHWTSSGCARLCPTVSYL